MEKNKKANITVGKRIRMLREKNNLTQEQLAQAMYVTKGTISLYENDSVDIKCSVLSELAVILNSTPNYLLWGNEKGIDLTALEPDTARLIAAFEIIGDEKIKRLILAQIEAASMLEV